MGHQSLARYDRTPLPLIEEDNLIELKNDPEQSLDFCARFVRISSFALDPMSSISYHSLNIY